MKSVIIHGYKFELVKNYNGDDDLDYCRICDLPENFCKGITVEHDNGKGWAEDSRYTYHIEHDMEDDMQCGTAKASVQRVIINKLNPKHLTDIIKITKVHNELAK